MPDVAKPGQTQFHTTHTFRLKVKLMMPAAHKIMMLPMGHTVNSGSNIFNYGPKIWAALSG